MKLGTKLVAGFLVVALVLVAISGLAIILQDKVNSVKAEVDNIRAEQDDMVEFGFAIYNEHAMAVRCFTTFTVSDMDIYIENKNDTNAVNSITAAALLAGFQEKSTTSQLHVEIASEFTVVMGLLDEAHTCFVENSTRYANWDLSLASEVPEVLNTLGVMLEEAMNNQENSINSIVELINSEILSLEEDENVALATLNNSIFIGVVVAIVLAIGIGLVLSNTMTLRLSNMIDAAKSIKMGNLDVSVNETGSDEITELGKAFNQMIMSVRLVAGDMEMREDKNDEGPGAGNDGN